MAVSRSAEDQRKEFDIQAAQTIRINQRLHSALDSGDLAYKERLEDLAVFANTLRTVAPEGTSIVLFPRPEIQFHAEEEDFSATLFITGNNWRYKVNGTTEAISVDAARAYKPGRQLLRMWEAAIPHLPENFIIRSVRGTDGSDEVKEARDHICEYLGLSVDPVTRHVLGIVRSGKVDPLFYDEFRSLTQITPDYLDQRFNTRRIIWPGA